MPRMVGVTPFGLTLVAATLLATVVTPHAAVTDRLAQLEDAFVEIDHSSARWTIGNDQVTYAVGIDGDGAFQLRGLRIAGNDDVLTTSDAPDALATIGGRTVGLGASDSHFEIVRVDAATGPHFVSMSVRMASEVFDLAATRHYVVYPHAAAVEMWTEFETLSGDTRTIENLNAYALIVPQGTVDWIAGLDAAAEDGGAFTRRSRNLDERESMDLGSTTLSSEQAVPYFSIGNGHRRFISGLIWSGAWTAHLERHGGDIAVRVGLPAMSAWAQADRSVEGPHAFVGVVLDRPGADVAAVTRFVQAGRAGRAFPALTTFNTWFVHGTHMDESTILHDIDLASEIGVELIQLDAGWYPGADPDQPFDFTSGLGSWQTDADRFPSGLAALRDYAHARGMQFGIWVEPERVDRRTVGGDGLAEERFLATRDGEYSPGRPNEEAPDGKICLADPAARAWVLRRLTQFLDEVGPDSLKWDVNRWLHCNRPGHNHPADGGNYEHTRGLYEILAAIRQRYPALAIENCAGGGRRIDFAMARLTDTAWMDDRTAPASHVRYNLDGLGAAFPSEYLFSYVMPHPDEPVRGGVDIAQIVRSRLPGVLGLATDLTTLAERDLNELNQQIMLAKQLRPLQAGAVTHLLTPQTRDYGQWDVVQQVLPSGAHLVFAFSNGAHDPIRVSLRAIDPSRTYELRSADRGTLGYLRGADLVAGGFEILEAPESWAQVLVLDPTFEILRKP